VVQDTVTEVQDAVLREWLDQLEALRLDARSLTDGLSADQLNWRPEPGRWSIAQCLEHITLTLRLYPEKMEQMIRESRERQARGARAYGEGAFSRWFVSSMEPPARMRVRTARRVDPSKQPGTTPLDTARVLTDFDAELTRFGRSAAAADGVSLVHGRTSSPFFALLRFTLGQVIAMNLAHARRHLWQARQVRQHARFPQTVEAAPGSPQ
jgi:hypothetical protein